MDNWRQVGNLEDAGYCANDLQSRHSALYHCLLLYSYTLHELTFRNVIRWRLIRKEDGEDGPVGGPNEGTGHVT